MTSGNLYIVGNGFDIYHGIPSRYSDFKEYLRSGNQRLHDHVVKYLPVRKNWCDLEIAFACLDVDHLIDDAMQYLQSYSSDNWSDSFHHDYQYELDKIVADLSSGLKSYFCEWISQLNLPSSDNLPCDHLRISKSATFLSFNYTRTLQGIYDVCDEDVLHIHGESEQDESQVILGHSWCPQEIPDLNDVQNPEDMDTRIMEGNERINSYFKQTFKPSNEIIEDNYLFFSKLSNIRKVYVLGHSMSEVDFPYFEKVVNNIGANTEWVVTYHEKEELSRHSKTIKNLGVNHVKFCVFSEI